MDEKIETEPVPDDYLKMLKNSKSNISNTWKSARFVSS